MGSLSGVGKGLAGLRPDLATPTPGGYLHGQPGGGQRVPEGSHVLRHRCPVVEDDGAGHQDSGTSFGAGGSLVRLHPAVDLDFWRKAALVQQRAQASHLE